MMIGIRAGNNEFKQSCNFIPLAFLVLVTHVAELRIYLYGKKNGFTNPIICTYYVHPGFTICIKIVNFLHEQPFEFSSHLLNKEATMVLNF